MNAPLNEVTATRPVRRKYLVERLVILFSWLASEVLSLFREVSTFESFDWPNDILRILFSILVSFGDSTMRLSIRCVRTEPPVYQGAVYLFN